MTLLLHETLYLVFMAFGYEGRKLYLYSRRLALTRQHVPVCPITLSQW